MKRASHIIDESNETHHRIVIVSRGGGMCPGFVWDRNAPERRSGRFFDDRNAVPVLFHAVIAKRGS